MAKDGTTRTIQLRECMVIPGARGCAVVSIGRLMQDKQARVFTQSRDGATLELCDGATVILNKESGLVIITAEGSNPEVEVQPQVSKPKKAERTTADGRADRGAPRGQTLEKEVQATIEEHERVQIRADGVMQPRASRHDDGQRVQAKVVVVYV